MSVAVRARVVLLTSVLVLGVAGCGGAAVKPKAGTSGSVTGSPSPVQSVAMARPGVYKPSGATPDILVQSPTSLSAAVVQGAARTKGVKVSEQFSMATFYREEEAITYAAVNPATFRQFTPGPTATLNDVWDRLADGEIALRPDLRQQLAEADDYVTLGNDDNAQRAHIGAYAPLVDRSRIGALLNQRWAARLHMPEGNALLISTGKLDPAPVLKSLRKSFGKQVSVTLLAPNVDPSAALAAVLTGGSIARAVGSFTYTANKDGTVNPEARWVREYIRSEVVPILGNVTCNKAMLPQLRAALGRIQRSGLASKIHRGEYGGCYVPRFIARDPSRGLSFHTFGTAIDLNVPGNQRGTVGLIDRRVVRIMQECGFNWGGTWNYTDPMHFELARLTAC
ncbi:M15 family peptidase [Nocardioides marmoriginsengisoli]|uniref:M15 family peptidase n=1 Tax=Nocardioides marmoriginsengisoli TaxID=661483 RepID=A0A3N0CG75_9ACTN|nr:M15 family metallopeptidase [Nocardioides marmoriginsengisoli]RNL61993.1 M15 family peptidase [Nocardioides marmoriginsengisoli]